jgi:GNAT superfamily N-acetyltransferase
LIAHTIHIKKALSDELHECYKFVRNLADFEGEPENTVISEEEFMRFADSQNPVFQILTAKDGEKIVGIALYYYRYSTWKGRHIHLEDLFVEEEYRHHGIGSAFFNRLIALAKEEKIRRIEWEVHDTNKKAQNFYRKLGAEVNGKWQICRLELEEARQTK